MTSSNLEADDGLCEVLESPEEHYLTGDEQQAIEARWPRGGQRTFPSPTAVRDYLQDVEPSEPSMRAGPLPGLTPGQRLQEIHTLTELYRRGLHSGWMKLAA